MYAYIYIYIHTCIYGCGGAVRASSSVGGERICSYVRMVGASILHLDFECRYRRNYRRGMHN